MNAIVPAPLLLGYRLLGDANATTLMPDLPFADLESPPQVGERLLVVADWRRLPELLALQQRALAAGASLLFVGLEPGALSIGPWVASQTPCLGCLRQWLRLNLQEPGHWSAQSESAALCRQAQQPLSSAQRAMARTLIEQALAAPDTLHGVQRRLDWATLEMNDHRFQFHPDCEVHPLPMDSAEAARWPALSPMPLAEGALRQANPKLSLKALREQCLDRRTGVVKQRA